MKKSQFPHNRKDSFAYLELLIVIVIISVTFYFFFTAYYKMSSNRTMTGEGISSDDDGALSPDTDSRQPTSLLPEAVSENQTVVDEARDTVREINKRVEEQQKQFEGLFPN